MWKQRIFRLSILSLQKNVEKIQEETEKYFEGQEIVGWFFSQRSIPLEATELLKRVHLKHFGGGEKVLMLMDPAERKRCFSVRKQFPCKAERILSLL